MKVLINLIMSLEAAIKLDNRATEIAIIILSTALLETSVYGRYILVSMKLPYYSKFLEDFDIYLQDEQYEQESKEIAEMVMS